MRPGSQEHYSRFHFNVLMTSQLRPCTKMMPKETDVQTPSRGQNDHGESHAGAPLIDSFVKFHQIIHH